MKQVIPRDTILRKLDNSNTMYSVDPNFSVWRTIRSPISRALDQYFAIKQQLERTLRESI